MPVHVTAQIESRCGYCGNDFWYEGKVSESGYVIGIRRRLCDACRETKKTERNRTAGRKASKERTAARRLGQFEEQADEFLSEASNPHRAGSEKKLTSEDHRRHYFAMVFGVTMNPRPMGTRLPDFEAGLPMADAECKHGRLPNEGKHCGCWRTQNGREIDVPARSGP